MRLAFRQIGAGKDSLIALHGLFGNGLTWKSFGEKLVSNFPRWTIYSLDARNHGDSPAADTLSIEEMTNDLDEFIKEHSIKNPTIMGHSMVYTT